jgi:hypothetical protein
MIEPEVKTGLTPNRLARVLWFLVFAPPLAWALHLLVAYSLHRSACESLSNALLLAVSLLVVVPAFTGWRAYALWQSWPDPYAGGGAGAPEEVESRTHGRERFLALSAFVFACFFALMILGQTVPMVMLRPCD